MYVDSREKVTARYQVWSSRLVSILSLTVTNISISLHYVYFMLYYIFS